MRSMLLAVLLMSVFAHAANGDGKGVRLPKKKSPELLSEGWKSRSVIPRKTANGRDCRLDVWVEDGWLLVRRSASDDEIEWQVVLARASDPAIPRIKLDAESGELEVRYREYFVREGVRAGQLRIYRELKTEESPEWAPLTFKGTPQRLLLLFDLFSIEQWCWVAFGPSKERPDLWVRLQPMTGRMGTASREGSIWRQTLPPVGPTDAFYGDSQVQDEGDLFVGTRMSFDVAEQGLTGRKLADAMESKRAPGLEAREWLNDPPPVSLENHVVLLYFWADWCKASVNKLPQIERLHKKFRDRGLLVVGVHSSERSNSAAKSVKDNHVSFPVMIDSSEHVGPADKSVVQAQHLLLPAMVDLGTTAKRYRVGALPNCFVVDKSGKVVWGYGMLAPSDEYIEDLLK